mmetsp:Transcript_11163/g.24899  ORF Transcript_11163/g.24899 Transcript_11163/m.24899 type:complete len:323 (-) Transcript_11163:251-1219(-)
MLLWRPLIGSLGSSLANCGATRLALLDTAPTASSIRPVGIVSVPIGARHHSPAALARRSIGSHRVFLDRRKIIMPPTLRSHSSVASNEKGHGIKAPPKKKSRSTPKKKLENNPKKGTNTATTKSKDNDPSETHSSAPWFNIFTKGDKDYNHYMATEWSYETRGDRALFERLSLEGAQAGLSWLIILRKREAYRSTFYNFDPQKVAQMTDEDVDRILSTEPANKKDTTSVIVRHRGKVESVIHNAKLLLELQKEKQDTETALDALLWSFVDDKPVLNYFGKDRRHDQSLLQEEFPTHTPESQPFPRSSRSEVGNLWDLPLATP